MKHNWTLTALRYADSWLSENQIFRGGDPEVMHPITFILYLIETEGRRILMDPGCDTMPGFDMRNFILPVEMLKTVGLTPAEITDVVITHAHHDHIDAVRHFPDSRIHIQAAEYESGRGYIPDGFRVETFEEAVELAPGIRVQKIGGHSPGSSVVILDEAWVLCGDECYLRRCLTEKIPTGNSYDPEKSRWFVETYCDAKYKTFLCHDPEVKTGILKG